MMEFVNEVTAQESRPALSSNRLCFCSRPTRPRGRRNLGEIGHKQTLAYEPWPRYDEALLKESTITVVVQVNGKVRDKLEVPAGISNADLRNFPR